MTKIYAFSPKQEIEVERIVNGKLRTLEKEKFQIYLIKGREIIFYYCKFRPIKYREDGSRFLTINLKREPQTLYGIIPSEVLEDEESYIVYS
jgi:hypothetical protein